MEHNKALDLRLNPSPSELSPIAERANLEAPAPRRGRPRKWPDEAARRAHEATKRRLRNSIGFGPHDVLDRDTLIAKLVESRGIIEQHEATITSLRLDCDALVWRLSSSANPDIRHRIGLTPGGEEMRAGTVRATPEVLDEHRSYADRHRIELIVYRFERDGAGNAASTGLAKFDDPVEAVEFARQAGERVVVMAENYGPYWRSTDASHVMPWALTSYVAWKHSESDKVGQMMWGRVDEGGHRE